MTRIINPASGKETVDYTGRSKDSVTVIGLVSLTFTTNILLEPVWKLYCSRYDCFRVVNVKTLRPMLSDKKNVSGRGWESRYDKLIGVVYPGTTLTVLSHALKSRKKGNTTSQERHVECSCYISNTVRWITAHDLTSGNTKSFKLYSSIRPAGLLIDPLTEEFIGVNSVYKGVTTEATDGRLVTYYRVTIDGLPRLLHRVVWFLHHGVEPSEAQEIHHKDHNTLDNRVQNLELLDRKGVRNNSQSLHKMRTVRGRVVTSKYKGVSWDSRKKKWVASIGFRKKTIFLGRFDDEEDAKLAYDRRVAELNSVQGTIFTSNANLHSIH